MMGRSFQGGGKPGNSPWIRAKKVGSHQPHLQHLAGEWDYVPWGLETLLPARPLLLPVLPLGSCHRSRKSPFLLLATRGAGGWEVSRLHGRRAQETSPRLPWPSPATENMEPPISRSWSWWEGGGARSWLRRWHCGQLRLQNILEPHLISGMLSTEMCLARGDRCRRPTYGRGGLERWPPAHAISLGKDQTRDRFLLRQFESRSSEDGCLLYILLSV